MTLEEAVQQETIEALKRQREEAWNRVATAEASEAVYRRLLIQKEQEIAALRDKLKSKKPSDE